jgi:hypothetical protein
MLFKSRLKIHEKIFNIIRHQRKVNQNYIEILSHPNQNGYPQDNKQQQMLARMYGGNKN